MNTVVGMHYNYRKQKVYGKSMFFLYYFLSLHAISTAMQAIQHPTKDHKKREPVQRTEKTL
jgi:hypothetical protein